MEIKNYINETKKFEYDVKEIKFEDGSKQYQAFYHEIDKVKVNDTIISILNPRAINIGFLTDDKKNAESYIEKHKNLHMHAIAK